MKKYLEDLEKELKKLKISSEEIKEIMADHIEMLEEAKNEGLSDEDMAAKFGDPKKVAKELYRDGMFDSMGVDSDDKQDGKSHGYTLFKSFEEATELSEVMIHLVNEDFSYLPSEGTSIEVFVKRLKDEEDYIAEYENGTFSFKRVTKLNTTNIFGDRSIGTKFIIKVPECELNNLSVKMVSGDFKLEAIKTQSLVVKTTSGDGKINGAAVFEDIKIDTVSGDLKLMNVSANNLELTMVSGDAKLIHVDITNDIHVQTVSGDLDAQNISGTFLHFRTVSGDFDGQETYVEKVQIKSVSGDFNINNDSHEQEIVVVSKKTLSGDVTIK